MKDFFGKYWPDKESPPTGGEEPVEQLPVPPMPLPENLSEMTPFEKDSFRDCLSRGLIAKGELTNKGLIFLLEKSGMQLSFQDLLEGNEFSNDQINRAMDVLQRNARDWFDDKGDILPMVCDKSNERITDAQTLVIMIQSRFNEILGISNCPVLDGVGSEAEKKRKTKRLTSFKKKPGTKETKGNEKVSEPSRTIFLNEMKDSTSLEEFIVLFQKLKNAQKSKYAFEAGSSLEKLFFEALEEQLIESQLENATERQLKLLKELIEDSEDWISYGSKNEINPYWNLVEDFLEEFRPDEFSDGFKKSNSIPKPGETSWSKEKDKDEESKYATPEKKENSKNTPLELHQKNQYRRLRSSLKNCRQPLDFLRCFDKFVSDFVDRGISMEPYAGLGTLLQIARTDDVSSNLGMLAREYPKAFTGFKDSIFDKLETAYEKKPKFVIKLASLQSYFESFLLLPPLQELQPIPSLTDAFKKIEGEENATPFGYGFDDFVSAVERKKHLTESEEDRILNIVRQKISLGEFDSRELFTAGIKKLSFYMTPEILIESLEASGELGRSLAREVESLFNKEARETYQEYFEGSKTSEDLMKALGNCKQDALHYCDGELFYSPEDLTSFLMVLNGFRPLLLDGDRTSNESFSNFITAYTSFVGISSDPIETQSLQNWGQKLVSDQWGPSLNPSPDSFQLAVRSCMSYDPIEQSALFVGSLSNLLFCIGDRNLALTEREEGLLIEKMQSCVIEEGPLMEGFLLLCGLLTTVVQLPESKESLMDIVRGDQESALKNIDITGYLEDVQMLLTRFSIFSPVSQREMFVEALEKLATYVRSSAPADFIFDTTVSAYINDQLNQFEFDDDDLTDEFKIQKEYLVHVLYDPPKLEYSGHPLGESYAKKKKALNSVFEGCSGVLRFGDCLSDYAERHGDFASLEDLIFFLGYMEDFRGMLVGALEFADDSMDGFLKQIENSFDELADRNRHIDPTDQIGTWVISVFREQSMQSIWSPVEDSFEEGDVESFTALYANLEAQLSELSRSEVFYIRDQNGEWVGKSVVDTFIEVIDCALVQKSRFEDIQREYMLKHFICLVIRFIALCKEAEGNGLCDFSFLAPLKGAMSNLKVCYLENTDSDFHRPINQMFYKVKKLLG